MANKKSIVVPLVISNKEYRLYRWYSLMKENGYKFSDYIKYVLFCSVKDISCNIGTVHVNELQSNDSIRTSITITVNDGVLYDWIIDIDNSPVIRKSVLIKSILSNAIQECLKESDEYIPSYAELDLGPFMSNKYARYNTKESPSKREGIFSASPLQKAGLREEEVNNTINEDIDIDSSYGITKGKTKEEVLKKPDATTKSLLEDDKKRTEMEAFLATYSVGGGV